VTEEKIDIEKDHLVIYRDLQGRFKCFQWILAEQHSLEDIQAKIIEYNKKTAENKEICDKTAELVTDQLIMEICAYQKNQEQEKEKEDTDGKIETLRRVRRALELLQAVEEYLE